MSKFMVHAKALVTSFPLMEANSNMIEDWQLSTVDLLWLFLVTYYIAPCARLLVCLRSMLAILTLAVFFSSPISCFLKFLWIFRIFDIGRLVSFGYLVLNLRYMLQFYRTRQKASLEDVAAMKCRACTNNILHCDMKETSFFCI